MRVCSLTVCLVVGTTSIASAQEPANTRQLRDSLTFHASFDQSANADYGKGDRRVYSAKSTKRANAVPGLKGESVSHVKSGGRHGGALHIRSKSEWFPFYQGLKNITPPKPERPFHGTVSFWMQLDPAKDLPKGFVDPIQITDKKWNDASFFVDFTQENPRDFRLGAYSDYKFWNPQAKKYDEVPESERPLIPVKKLPFSGEKWTHVCFVWHNFNHTEPGQAVLYLDGKAQGIMVRPQQYSWAPEKVGIMLGINYAGKIDDLAIFNRALSKDEVAAIAALPDGIRALYQKR